MRAFAAMVIATVMMVATAAAQTSLADIKAQIGKDKSDLEEVDAMLASPDRNARIAAMKALLASGNPVFVKRAKEVGLFSSDSEMQAAALAALFEAGGPFRIEMDMSRRKDEETRASWWLSNNGGGWNADGKLGTFVFSTGPYNDEAKCWPFRNGRNCAVSITGVTISLQGWSDADGSLALGRDGVLIGSFRARSGAPLPARIPLVE